MQTLAHLPPHALAIGALTFVLYALAPRYRKLLVAALLVQSAYMVMRGLQLGRLPLVGVHDTLNFLSASGAAFALGVGHAMRSDNIPERHTRFMLSAMSVLSAIFTAIAALQPPKSGYLPPVLNTYWFELHVAMSFLSYALFALAAVLGLLYLMRREAACERLQYRVAFIGYALFSISMIFGGVWAYLAWGTYWLWTPKELWTSLLWIYYTLYLHARLHQPLMGRPSAAMGIAGYAVVLFTYLGVGLLMKSSHSF